MNKEMLERAVNGIDDKFIAGAQLNVKEGKRMHKKKMIIAAAVCAALVLLTVFGAAGVRSYIAMSPEHIGHLKEAAAEAVENGADDAEIAAIKAATGGFSDDKDVLMEKEPYMVINETVKDGGFVFELQEIRRGRAVRLRGNGESIVSPDFRMHEQIEDGLYAIVKVTCEDGSDMEQVCKDRDAFFLVSAVVSGHQPFWSKMCTYNDICSYYEDGAYYEAFDLSLALPFADRDIYLAVYDDTHPDNENAGNEDYEYMLLSMKDGVVSFSERYTYPHALFRIKLDDSLADKEAQKEFLKEHKGIDKIR